MRRKSARSGLLALALCLPTFQGCTVLYKCYLYTNDRVHDTLDMLDFGVTVSRRLSVSAYACLLGLGGVGGGTMDGYFAGVGGSRVGVFRHYNSTIGVVLYSYEVLGWGEFDLKDRDTLTRRHRGPVAWLFIKDSGACKGPT